MPREAAEPCFNVPIHFLDSGAFTLSVLADKHRRQRGSGEWDFYDTREHWEFLDAYAKFVKKYKVAIDFHANVDVIGNPKLTWRNQRYLESEHGLSPVPVIHFGTDLKWLEHYIAKRYEFIGVGGLAGQKFTAGSSVNKFLDEVFEIVCDTPDRTPRVRLHGFALTRWEVITRYPWYSVDSTSWAKAGGYGTILMPPIVRGKFRFDLPPIVVSLGKTSTKRITNHHGLGVEFGGEARVPSGVGQWLDFIGVPHGGVDPETGEKVHGVLNHHKFRKQAAILYYHHLVNSLPKYPWAYEPKRLESVL